MKKCVFIPGILAAALSVFAADSNAVSAPVVLVEINGQKITMNEFERKHPAAFFQARNSFFEAQRKVVEDYIDEYLLEEQAKKEGLTVAQLTEKHITSKAAQPLSEETLRAYYDGVDTQETYEGVREKIIEAIKIRRSNKIRAAYLKDLRAASTINFRVAPPRVQISMKDTPVRGAKNPKVMFVEYADYECPYCQQMTPALDKLKAEFKDQVAFAYKDVPLQMHPNAPKAAEAAHCAGSQGKYWEYHDLLWKNKQLEIPALKESARALGIDGKAFDKCLDSGEKAEIIKDHVQEATSMGINGTPVFVINGRYFSGALSYEKLRSIIEEEIGSTSVASQAPAKR